MFASHSWPRWGNERIQEVMRTQRDTYAHLNNQVLHLANQGVTINQVHNVYKLPDSLRNQWSAHSYHGSEEHNSRAVINRYLGYWDANPATLTPLSPEDSAPLYVEMMGGAKKIMNKGKELYDQGKYLHATEILNKLVYADPKTRAQKTCWPMYMNRSVIRKKARVFVTVSLLQLMSYVMECRAVHHPKRQDLI
jgi:alkyl sulfatase BDS1-like metallo-beta-lactamase superfamily hydrolase